MKYHKVTFYAGNVSFKVPEGVILKKIIQDGNIEFDFPCGGKGCCKKCKVLIKKGVSKPSLQEIKCLGPSEIDRGIRLACQTKVMGDLEVVLLSDKYKGHQILVNSAIRDVRPDPHFQKYHIQLDRPTINDNRPDWKRLVDALAGKGQAVSGFNIPIAVLRKLPGLLRSSKFRITAVVYDNCVIDIEPGDTTSSLLGMAFDIGTTTIVGYLMNLNTGEVLNTVSMLNPQSKYGADVVSRILYVIENKDGLKKMKNAVIFESINVLIDEATKNTGADREALYAIAVVGNTIMQHLLLGINPGNIGIAPYVPVVNTPLVIDQKDTGIKINPAGKAFIVPNIGGYVGADIVADILALEMDRNDDLNLLIDIGTNGEIVLGDRKRMLACATAAGPAFEGVNINCGMRGDCGAIDHVFMQPELNYSVIGGIRPEGICGSGLLDIVAELLKAGMIDRRGKFVLPDGNKCKIAEKNKSRIVDNNGSMAFLVAEREKTGNGYPILLTQGDVRQLQLAKGAIAAGMQALINIMGVDISQIKGVFLAGAFGNYLNAHNACTIGLIPGQLEDRVTIVGNTAGAGSKLALLSKDEFNRAKSIAEAVDYIELSTNPEFTKLFAKSCYF